MSGGFAWKRRWSEKAVVFKSLWSEDLFCAPPHAGGAAIALFFGQFGRFGMRERMMMRACLLYTSDAADE